ncbi:MAG: nuclear transport factor 2 family protein [bacterium]|nr:nuclear transport factor 2 family protein [bacterium]
MNELLALENAGWRSLCDGTGADFYGRLMMQDARMVLSNGIAMTRAQVVDSLARAPQWDGYSITDAMIVEMSATVVALTYTGTGRREHGEDFTGLMVTTYVKSGQQWRIGFYQQTPST